MIVEADIRPAPAADNGEAGRLLTSIGIVNLGPCQEGHGFDGRGTDRGFPHLVGFKQHFDVVIRVEPFNCRMSEFEIVATRIVGVRDAHDGLCISSLCVVDLLL